MVAIIFNIFALIVELVLSFWNYNKGEYVWAMIFSGVAGFILANIIWGIKKELE